MILKDTEIRNNTIILKLEDGGTTEKIAMSVDDFYSFHLASGMEIGEDQLKEIKAAAEKTAVFAKCLHKLAAHDRSTKEMRTWLRDTLKVSSSLRQEILDKLTERGYLDDERYCREQIGMMKSALKGERLIQETLFPEIFASWYSIPVSNRMFSGGTSSSSGCSSRRFISEKKRA